VLAVSAERDRGHALALAYWADGYRHGWAARDQVGGGVVVVDYNAATLDQMRGEWASEARARFAETDRLRYPPGGRLSWLLPRLGDTYECWQQYCQQREAR